MDYVWCVSSSHKNCFLNSKQTEKIIFGIIAARNRPRNTERKPSIRHFYCPRLCSTYSQRHLITNSKLPSSTNTYNNGSCTVHTKHFWHRPTTDYTSPHQRRRSAAISSSQLSTATQIRICSRSCLF